MDLKEIEAKADEYLTELLSTDSDAAAASWLYRLQGLKWAAEIKSTVAFRKEREQETTPAYVLHGTQTGRIEGDRCGYRWSWPDGNQQLHFEICTKLINHTGTLHYNGVTGLSTPILRAEEEPVKPVADRLHELVSYARGHAPDGVQEYPSDGPDAYRDMADKLEEMLNEGGI